MSVAEKSITRSPLYKSYNTYVPKVGSGRMLVPAYRALGWTGTSGPDAVSRSLLLTLFLLSMLIWIRLIQ